jgi:N-acetyl-anhydromuramyl-L-alanine amidase AmpD
MAAYSLRHYGESTAVLSNPKVIVEHYTETATAQEAFNTFASDEPDSEFHELPNTCAHFLVERSGRIDQLVALSLRCRHTTGLNWTAIGIEHVGFSDQAILSDPAQIAVSLRLTRWLRCRYAIALKNVIGHNESLASPYHHDLVPAFSTRRTRIGTTPTWVAIARCLPACPAADATGLASGDRALSSSFSVASRPAARCCPAGRSRGSRCSAAPCVGSHTSGLCLPRLAWGRRSAPWRERSFRA